MFKRRDILKRATGGALAIALVGGRGRGMAKEATAALNDLPTILGKFDRTTLLDGVTPIQRLERLERSLGDDGRGVRIYVKRDDLGLGGGGNKLRKLEFLLGQAIAQGCDTFITVGGLQSNHCRLSAAAAARFGMACELVLTSRVPRDDLEYRLNGNVLLDDLFGAKVHELSGDALAFAHQRGAELTRNGRHAYVVRSGGSTPIGSLGYANCAAEILAQERELGVRFAQIVLPNGGAGTHAGLAAGLQATSGDASRLRSFSVISPADKAQADTHALALETLQLMMPGATIAPAAVRVDGSQLAPGYGIPSDAMLDAVRRMARTEGLLLDPVYSGKAFAGLLQSVRRGEVGKGESVLFLMTGGTPGLFAYRSAFA